MYTDWLLNSSIAKNFDAFKRGFDLVMSQVPLADLFTAEEIELLVCGSNVSLASSPGSPLFSMYQHATLRKTGMGSVGSAVGVHVLCVWGEEGKVCVCGGEEGSSHPHSGLMYSLFANRNGTLMLLNRVPVTMASQQITLLLCKYSILSKCSRIMMLFFNSFFIPQQFLENCPRVQRDTEKAAACVCDWLGPDTSGWPSQTKVHYCQEWA